MASNSRPIVPSGLNGMPTTANLQAAKLFKKSVSPLHDLLFFVQEQRLLCQTSFSHEAISVTHFTKAYLTHHTTQDEEIP